MRAAPGRPPVGALTATLAAMFLSGCRPPPGTEAALPPQPTVVAVSMSEYRFEHRQSVGAGRVVFRVRNSGSVEHKLDLVRLPDDLAGTLDAQLRSADRRAVDLLDSLPGSPPGQSTVFAADLTPGRYGLICFLTDPDGTSHVLKGMSSELRVR